MDYVILIPSPPSIRCLSRSDRTVESFMEFLHTRIAHDEQVAVMSAEEKEAHEERKKQEKSDHPGCMMSGFLMVNR